MDIILLIAYIVILIFQIVLLSMSVKKGKKVYWISLYISELVTIAIAVILSILFNNLEGHGFMPGLTYLGEALFSMGAVVIFSIMLVSSLMVGILQKIKR